MRRAGLGVLPGTRYRRLKPDTPTAADLVDRQFSRDRVDLLWVTDITEHPTRGGKGVLRGGPGCLLPSGGQQVDRRPSTAVDLGSGDSAESLALLNAGRRVNSVDSEPAAVHRHDGCGEVQGPTGRFDLGRP
jgi:hypothetical protein